jgi:hypothetical protein
MHHILSILYNVSAAPVQDGHEQRLQHPGMVQPQVVDTMPMNCYSRGPPSDFPEKC